MKISSAHKNNGDAIDSYWGQANRWSPTTNWKCWPVNCENAGLGRPAYVYCCLKGHDSWWISIEFGGQAHLLLRICRIMVGLCLILIKNSFSFIMQQFFYPNNMHFQNGRNILISSDRLTAVVDGLQELLKVILKFVINLLALIDLLRLIYESKFWCTTFPFCAKRRNESSIACQDAVPCIKPAKCK